MQTPARRGRPRAADAHTIARVALRLFERRGFDRVTMHEVADAAGVSIRTLFRLFPTKSDLVWEGLNTVRDVVAARAASLAGAGLPPGDVLLAFAEPFLQPLDAPDVGRVARRRLRLIASAPALLDHPTLREIEAVLAATVAAGAAPPGTPPALIARTMVAVAFAALMWWADHGEDMTALDAVRAAYRGIAFDPAGPRAPTRARPRRPGTRAEQV